MTGDPKQTKKGDPFRVERGRLGHVPIFDLYHEGGVHDKRCRNFKIVVTIPHLSTMFHKTVDERKKDLVVGKTGFN